MECRMKRRWSRGLLWGCVVFGLAAIAPLSIAQDSSAAAEQGQSGDGSASDAGATGEAFGYEAVVAKAKARADKAYAAPPSPWGPREGELPLNRLK